MLERVDKSRAYVFESNPLKIALYPEVGDLVYTSLGDCFECFWDGEEELNFELIHPTVLVDRILLPDLNKAQLGLFWALSRTELSKVYHGVKDTN